MNKVALFAIIGTAMFLLSAGASFAATPSTGPVHIQPNPVVNTNITWSMFYSQWNPLEYNNGTANLTLPAGLQAGNAISINPTDIQSKALQNDNLSAYGIWETDTWNNGTGPHGVSAKEYKQGNEIKLETNESAGGPSYAYAYVAIPTTDIPSDNPAYDYITAIYGLSGPAQTGVSATIYIDNQTAVNPYSINTGNNTLTPGNEYYISENLAQIEKTSGYTVKLNATGANSATAIEIQLNINTPASTDNYEYTMTLYGLALTTYPITLGQNATGGIPTQALGPVKLAKFTPTEPMNITNYGYTAAVSEPLQNLTTQQNAISSGNYIEQVEYQGQFLLPTAPDLSYGSANLTEQFNVSTAQTQVLDINGVSYLSTISGKNGTVDLLTSVNPNQATQFLQIVDYTQSQWNSISSAPGIFTIAGIEYYWWIAVGGLATLIGLAAAAKHAGTKAEQERIRRGR